jgi:OmcA/MtrC family decaheme c-type cytochrome
MSFTNHFSPVRLSFAVWTIIALAGCGGGGGSGSTVSSGGSEGVAAVAASTGNSSAINPLAAFTAISGIPLVTVASPPHVNFTVINQNGQVVQGLTLNGTPVLDPLSNSAVTCNTVRFAIAKLVRDPLGVAPDQWVNYIYQTEVGTPGVGPGGVVQAPNSKQATTDPTNSASLVFNSAGYYTYTFTTDIRTPTAANNNVAFEPTLTHRVGIQLCFVDSDGSIVRVNPYYDFTFVPDPNVPNGYRSKLVTNPANTHVVVDKASCNECHLKLAVHGGGRVDPQYCVLCHNPSTTDANSGNVLDFKTMIHKIHSGKLLASATDGAPSTYEIWGYQDALSDFSDVGFPQDLRNCTKCHDGSPGAAHPTPQGDNWMTKASKGACLTCHKTDPTSPWYATHITHYGFGSVDAIGDGACQACHIAGGPLNVGVQQVHWNQNQQDAALYKVVINSASYNSATRTVTLGYSVVDPTHANAPYDLKADCAGACTSSNRFGNLQFLAAYLDMVGTPSSTADFSSVNNGGGSASAYATNGVDDGTHHYTVKIAIPVDTATALAHGTARIVSYGQVIEPELDVRTRTPTGNTVNVSILNTYQDLPLDNTGPVVARRDVVSDTNCNACHGLLGTTVGGNTVANAFHSGAMDSVLECPVCHDANFVAANFMLTGGDLGLLESMQFKRMIHGIHGAAKRENPLFFGVDNLDAEVRYPAIISNCVNCHLVDAATGIGTFEMDQGMLGTAVVKSGLDPLGWEVISPKAATCSACHDSVEAQAHMTTVGGAAFGGGKTQANILTGTVFESCDACHGLATGFEKVRDVHHVNTTTD